MFRIMLFYLPMGASSLLAALTHVIVNSVLARSPHPEVTIASYAVALSFSFLLDMPMNAIRQTSSRYARDRTSFRSVFRLSCTIAAILLTISIIIGWTPVGEAMFHYVFGVKDQLLASTVQVYQVLAFLYAFTAMRSLFQGVIINRLRTFWMTVGMAVRVVLMFGMSWFFIQKGWTDDGRIGAWIFMAGVMIECLVAVSEGRSLSKKLPEGEPEQQIGRTVQLLPFYMPLVYSSIMIAILNPSVQAALNKTVDPVLAVAAFAVATQLCNMTAWFCASVHQIVLQFYKEQKRNVLLVVAGLSVLAPTVLLIFSSEAWGSWMLVGVQGLQGELLEEVRVILRFLAVQSFIFPWIDFVAGKSMLNGKTKVILQGKMVSVALSIILLIVLLNTVPQSNGVLASIATAAAAPFELLVVYLALRRSEQQMNKLEVSLCP